MKTTVDFAYGEATLDEAFRNLLRRWPHVNFSIVQVNGVGGWPEIELEGSAAEIARVLREDWQVTDDAELWTSYGVPTHKNFATTYKCTTDKLNTVINELRAGGWSEVTPYFVGGRDWVVVAQRYDV